MLTNGGHHHVFPPRTYQIADQGTARGSKSGHNHKGYSGDIAYDIGYGQSTLSEVFHEKKEQEPGGKRDKILYHRPKRHVEHPAKFTPTVTHRMDQTVFD